MDKEFWSLEKGSGPLVAAAVHNGHEIRDDLNEILFISENARLREEDPFTGIWTSVADTRVIGLRSRFEVDLNRPREKAVYQTEQDAWGIKVWNSTLPPNQYKRSLNLYDDFYAGIHDLLSEKERQYGHFVVFDIHSYNHQRDGDGIQADPDLNPEVNIGTGTMDREYWTPVVDSFITALHNFNYFGRQLDVRENVKFRGGNFPKWIHKNFPKSGCAIAIEFKKIFMNEWTGDPDHAQINMILNALRFTVQPVLKALDLYDR